MAQVYRLSKNSLTRIKLVAYVGKSLVATISNTDSARDPEDLSTFTAFGKIVDEDDALILDLTPTTANANGSYIINKASPGGTTAGHYRWKGGVIDSAGDYDVRYEGPVHLRTY